jgi:hypothetical protein
LLTHGIEGLIYRFLGQFQRKQRFFSDFSCHG